MKLLYLSTWDFTNEESDGVCKKIYSQISVFEKEGYHIDFIYIKDNKIMYRENGQIHIIGTVGSIKKTPAYMKMYKYLKNKKYDWVYNRYGMMDTFYYRVLKTLKSNGARILIEIPTYPYINEIPKSFLYSLMVWWDRFYIRRLDTFVDRIATYSLDNMIFDIKTIKIKNGVDFSQIALKKEKRDTNSLDLIGVAHVSKWHGFDRIIEGLKNYYIDDFEKKEVNFHIVGEGEVLEEYKEIVRKYKLEKHVLFYGKKSGRELDEIYNQCDVAISSLGLHRIGITEQASVLKSREYAAKGMPMISSILIDIFPPDEYKYIKYFSEDDTPINIVEIITWYQKIRVGDEDVRSKIRDYAFAKCDQSVVSEPIIKYMKES